MPKKRKHTVKDKRATNRLKKEWEEVETHSVPALLPAATPDYIPHLPKKIKFYIMIIIIRITSMTIISIIEQIMIDMIHMKYATIYNYISGKENDKKRTGQ